MKAPMKKIIPCLLFVLCLLGCDGKRALEENSQIYDYFPFKENVMMIYEGEGGASPFASYTVFNTFVRGNRLQRRISLNSIDYNKQTEVLDVTGGEFRLINGDTFSYHYQDQTRYPEQKDMLLLKEPLDMGAKWEISPGETAEVTGVDITVDTPLGSFKAIEITSAFSNGFTGKDYYAKGIGLVKGMYTGPGSEPIISVLSQYIEDTAVPCEYYSFYPIPDSDGILTLTDTVSLSTNYDLTELVNSIIHKPSPDGVYPALLSQGAVKEIKFAENASAVIIDFDRDVYNQGYESEIQESANLYSVALTCGKFLSAEQVFIRVDGEPYSGVYVKKTEDDVYMINTDQDQDQEQG